MTLKWKRANKTETTNERKESDLIGLSNGQTNAPGFSLVKRTLRWKNFMPKNFLEINRYFALTSYYNTIGQSNNAFSILGFLWRENEEAMVWSFHPLADETKNEHLPKPFFKVIGKSLYQVKLLHRVRSAKKFTHQIKARKETLFRLLQVNHQHTVLVAHVATTMTTVHKISTTKIYRGGADAGISAMT